MKNSGKILLAVLGGLVAGVTLGILFAPDKGSETRKKVKDMADKAKDKVKETAENIKQKMKYEHNGKEETNATTEGDSFA
jgi:gas vesicle protein